MLLSGNFRNIKCFDYNRVGGQRHTIGGKVAKAMYSLARQWVQNADVMVTNKQSTGELINAKRDEPTKVEEEEVAEVVSEVHDNEKNRKQQDMKRKNSY